MKKNLIALAIASAVAVPAMAQNVTLSGRASMEWGGWRATGSTAGAASDFQNRQRVADTASRIAFGVTEDLGGGLRAGVYCETGINIDTATANGQANTANANTSEWCSREGRASIGNNMVEVRLGRQNVWWTQGELNRVGSTFLGTDAGTNLFNQGVGVAGVRLENMVMVHGNSGLGAFAGSNVYYGYLTTGEAVAANATPRGKYNGAKVQWSQGSLIGMLDIQRSEDPDGATAIRDRSATKLGVGYRYSGSGSPNIISVQAWDKSRTLVAGAAKTTDDGWLVTGLYDLGGGTMLHGQYGKNNGTSGTADSGATGMTVGLTRSLSKRTHLYGSFHTITNGAAGTYALSGGNYQSGTPAAGADTRAYGLGMIHNF